MTPETCRAAIVARAPSLAAGARQWDETEWDPGDWVHVVAWRLTAAILDRKDLAGLRDVAPVIEQLLAENDDGGGVSLGFVETVFWAARDGQLPPDAAYAALGPGARSVWDDLLDGERRHDIRAVQYTERDVGRAPADATLVTWGAAKGRWTQPGTALATLSIGGRPARLVATERCLLDRVASEPSERLTPGTLLCYLAVWDRTTPREARLCEVVEGSG